MTVSPNAPRPADPLVLDVAGILAAVEANYAREGSGPGSRFEGQLLEDAQARRVVREVLSHGGAWREHADADHAALGRVAALAGQLDAGDHDAEFSEGWPWHITDRFAAMIREALDGPEPAAEPVSDGPFDCRCEAHPRPHLHHPPWSPGRQRTTAAPWWACWPGLAT